MAPAFVGRRSAHSCRRRHLLACGDIHDNAGLFPKHFRDGLRRGIGLAMGGLVRAVFRPAAVRDHRDRLLRRLVGHDPGAGVNGEKTALLILRSYTDPLAAMKDALLAQWKKKPEDYDGI